MKRTPEEIQACVEGLLSQMTLEEKIGQMVQSAGNDVSAIGGRLDTLPMEGLVEKGLLGSTIYISAHASLARRLQEIAVNKSRLGIPLLFCQDVIHGFQTVFPIPLGWSCSFDPELVGRAVEISAKEATRAGVMLAFSPMLDIARDPRWGRISEGEGEDPYLAGRMAKAQVEGYQGGRNGAGLGDGEHVACCLKHFVQHRGDLPFHAAQRISSSLPAGRGRGRCKRDALLQSGRRPLLCGIPLCFAGAAARRAGL